MVEVLELKNKKFVVNEVKAVHPDHTTYTCTWCNRPYLARTFNDEASFVAAMTMGFGIMEVRLPSPP